MARPVVSRRALLTCAGMVTLGGSLAQAMTACRFDPDTSAPPDSPGPTPTTSADPDTETVVAARAALSGLVSHLMAGLDSVENKTLITFHTTQLAALGGQAPRTTRLRLTPKALVAQERMTQARFLHWAQSCQSGELARVLASVAAGIGMLPVVREATP